MMKVCYIAWKEIKTYFLLPIATLIIPFFLFLLGSQFYSHLSRFQALTAPTLEGMRVYNISLQTEVVVPYFQGLHMLLLLIIPIICMRLLAEEKKLGTFEFLKTSPVSAGHIVIGKFLGAALFFSLILGLSLAYPGVITLFGNPDLGPIASGYLGIFLFGLLYLSLGLFVSSLTENQIIAALVSLGGMMCFYLFPWLASLSSGFAEDFFFRISILQHLKNFQQGLIYTDDIVIYGTLTILFLFGAYVSVLLRR